MTVELTTRQVSVSRLRDFQDAIHATRKLGMRYPWIDALCILQDSPEDVSTHSARNF